VVGCNVSGIRVHKKHHGERDKKTQSLPGPDSKKGTKMNRVGGSGTGGKMILLKWNCGSWLMGWGGITKEGRRAHVDP